MGDWDIEAHPLSASKLKTFNGCPQQFYLKYVEGLDGLKYEPYYLDIGNAVHYTLEECLRRLTRQDARLDMEYADLKGVFLATLPDALDGSLSFATPDPRQSFPIELNDTQREQVVACLDTAAKWLGSRSPYVRGVEDELDFRISRPDIDVPVTGYMDLSTGNPEGSDDSNEVVDWKTGKSENKGTDEALQGATYMAGFYHLYGQAPDAIHFVYLNPEKGDDHPKVRTLDPDDDLWQTLLGQARTLMAAYEANEYPAQPTPSKCNWCDHELYCGASPVGAGNVDWETYP